MSNSPRDLSEFESKHSPSPELRLLRSRVAELERLRNQERMATGEAQDIIFSLQKAIDTAKPVEMVYKPKKKNSVAPITQVLHLTDLHYGEVIEEAEVEGINKFNPDIAKRRLSLLGEKTLQKAMIGRSGYNIQDLHILGTADFISGDIHQELQVTNAFPCPVQAVECGYTLGALVMMLAPHYRKITVDMITLDNHGRMTRKNQAAEGGLNNWSYVVAQVMKQRVIAQENVDVRIHARATALVEIGSERYLMMHGHQIKGWAGIPYYGFDRRTAMEAMKRMNLPDLGFTKMVIGHFHVSVDSPSWVIGGSLSGTNAFDHSCGRSMQAHQTGWFVHPSHGQFDFTRWWLGDGQKKLS